MIHETAIVDSGAVIGEDCAIWHHCHVMAGAVLGARVTLGQNGFVASGVTIGDDCRIQNNVSLYEGVTLGRGVFVGPSAVFTNVTRPRALYPRKAEFEPTRVGDGATLGANCTVICGHDIGEAAMVAAGAVVTRDVPAFALVVGAPARRSGWVCRCGEKIPLDPRKSDLEIGCVRCEARYRLGDGGMIDSVP